MISRISLTVVFVLFQVISLMGQGDVKYQIATQPWAESFGNHRAVLQLDQAGDQIFLDLTWRRHDPDPQDKAFLIISAASGDTIPIIKRQRVDAEKCELFFGPVGKPGIYYFYYLPYRVQEGWGFYGGDYLREQTNSNKPNVSDVASTRVSRAQVIGLESRTGFDSFYPMEVIALQTEIEKLTKQNPQDFLIFPEDRQFPIRMKDRVPLRWIQKGPSDFFEGPAAKNEYYVFQIGVYASQGALDNLNLRFSDILLQYSGKKPVKEADLKITCFNTAGIDPYGNAFTHSLNVAAGTVQALWIGVDIPASLEAEQILGSIEILAEGVESQKLNFKLQVLPETLPDRGDGEPWRHSRLRWLNSTAGIDDLPAFPYQAVDESFVTYGAHGFPRQINKDQGILASGIQLVFESDHQTHQFHYSKPEKIKNSPGVKSWINEWKSQTLTANLHHSLEFDGYQRYTLNLVAHENCQWDDIRLEIPFLPEASTYLMGMGLPGGTTPETHRYHWQKPEDSFWIGSSQAGLWCEIRGSSYHGPLLNLYKPGHPRPWYNDGAGYLSISRSESQTMAQVGTGPIQLFAGKEYTFEFALLPTPVKEINPTDQFTNRYYHNGGSPDGFSEELESGIQVLNVHHANSYNPYINYPFIAVQELHELVERGHDLGVKVKIYYTIRELTNYVTEIWALRSLGDEIIRGGPGGGYPWLREHFISDYTPQWYQHFENGTADASVLNSTQVSRWYNYYIEGLAWLVRNQNIDGIYLDDVSFDRNMLKRMRKVMEAEKPGCLIDLHSNTGFSKGPAIQYTEYFPYVDKLWFGESFQYNQMSPENWLVEVSGIPFGLMGDMLHGGGNRWLGMLFGMTVRLPWTSEGAIADPRPVWKFWDDFKIAEAEIIGFWEPDCPAYSSDPNVKVTIYRKKNEVLFALGNFGNSETEIELKVDWKALDMHPDSVDLVSPEISNYQEYRHFLPNETISLPGKKGLLIRARKK